MAGRPSASWPRSRRASATRSIARRKSRGPKRSTAITSASILSASPISAMPAPLCCAGVSRRRLPSFHEHVKLHVTGCPNSCGQHWIADIGVEGKKLKIDGALVDAYYFCVGGALGARQAVARPIGLRVPASEVASAVERLLRAYLAERHAGETFRAFAARH